MVVWGALPAGASERGTWYSWIDGLTGASTSGQPRRLAPLPGEVSLVALKAQGDRGDFVLVSSRQGNTGDALEALVIGGHGEVIEGPLEITAGAQRILWVDALPLPGKRSAVLWTERQAEGARMMISRAGGREKPTQPLPIASPILAWQAIPTPQGLALATVAGGANKGQVTLTLLDDSPAPKTVILKAPGATEPDVDLVRSGPNLLIAWTSRQEDDTHMELAVTDLSGGIVRPAETIADGLDNEMLVQLVAPHSPEGPAFLAYQSEADDPEKGRKVHLARLSSSFTWADERLVSIRSEDQLPEFAATPRGVAVMTLAPDCPVNSQDPALRLGCTRSVPVFVELDAALAPLAVEPLRLEHLRGANALAAWGLSCGSGPCVALATSPSDPTQVFMADLERRSDQWVSPVTREAPQTPPRIQSIQTVATLDPVSDIVVQKAGNREMSAWISYFDPSLPWQRTAAPGPDGRTDPLQATLQVAVSGSPQPFAVETISRRAQTLGGVALAPALSGRPGSLLAWTAMDNGVPQVFLTELDPNGKRLIQKVITRTRGAKSDVALAAVADGWVLGWIDERDGDPEVYLTKINRALRQTTPEFRLTRAAGAATNLILLNADERVHAVWSDARDPGRPGVADIFGAVVSGTDARVLKAEHSLFPTPGHSQLPQLALVNSAAKSSTVVLAWLDGTQGDAEQPPSLLLATLNSEGTLLGTPTRLSEGLTAPMGLALDCTPGSAPSPAPCHLVIDTEIDGHTQLDAVLWTLGQDPVMKSLARLGNRGSTGASVALQGNYLFFSDSSSQPNRGRVRRGLLEW